MALGETSYLFVPADNPRLLASAWSAPADALIVDLEDAVADARKDIARELLEAQLAHAAPAARLCVRINALDTADAAADLALVGRHPEIGGLVVPKARASLLSGRAWDRPVIAIVETAAGVLEARDIAACGAVQRLMLGTVDLATELGIAIDPAAPTFLHARAGLVLASAAAGIDAPIDGVWTGLEDDAGLEAEAASAKAAGFTAKACIHPRQIALVRRAFAPTETEIARAQRIVAAAAEQPRSGAIRVDGRMVDRPVVEHAERLLARAERSTTDEP